MASSVHSAAPSTSQPSLAPQARRTFQSAFQGFESTVKKSSANDVHVFGTTGLQDVRDAAKDIERQLAARQCLRNMKRIQPLLDGLEKYSKVVEVLCNGTPYLPWIWAPIKLMIQVLAVAYADILEFHCRAYEFFRKPSWKCFFLSSWGRFDNRFKCILESLARHSDLVDREANALSIAEAREWRERAAREAKKRETEMSAAQYRHVLSWLGDRTADQDAQDEQENRLDQLLGSCYPNTAEWILSRLPVKNWLRTQGNKPILWLKGKPGSGKSVLCSKLIQFLRQDGQSSVLFYFCSYANATSKQSTRILKSFAIQVLRRHQNLSSYVYDEYVLTGQTPSTQALTSLLPNLLASIQGPRMIIDGLDECQDSEQKDVLKNILAFSSNVTYESCPILIVSRDVRHINAVLSRKPSLSLNDEATAVDAAIGSFAKQRLLEMQTKFRELNIDTSTMEDFEKRLVDKSKGMFLWVRLVLDILEDDVYNANELRTAIDAFPVGLTELYERIILRIKSFSPQNYDKAVRILEWITFAKRAPKKYEVQDAVALTASNTILSEKTKLPETVLQLCRPLIEDGPDNTIVFVHFTVHEYFLHESSGPFLHTERAEYNLTLSCVTYMLQGINLINGRISEDERTVNVGKGFNGLHLYAVEYWLEHLLCYTQARQVSRQSNPVILDKKVSVLVALHKRYQSRVLGTQSYSHDHEALRLDADDDARLSLLKSQPETFGMARQLLRYRRRPQSESEDGVDGYVATPVKDPTPFSDTLHSYQRRVQLLLRSTTFPGLTPAELTFFKATYGSTAFTCRFPGCVQSTTGFTSDELRLQHERCHTPRLACSDSNCNYGLTFASLKALQRHVRENHKVIAPAIPPSIRRTARTTSSLEDETTRRVVSASNMQATVTGSENWTPFPRILQKPSIINAMSSVTSVASQYSSWTDEHHSSGTNEGILLGTKRDGAFRTSTHEEVAARQSTSAPNVPPPILTDSPNESLEQDPLSMELALLAIEEDPSSKHRRLCLEVYLIVAGWLSVSAASVEAISECTNHQRAIELATEVIMGFPVEGEGQSFSCYDCHVRQHEVCYCRPQFLFESGNSCMKCNRDWADEWIPLKNYQAQLLLLERQNKKRLVMARQESPGPRSQEHEVSLNAPKTIPKSRIQAVPKVPLGWVAQWDDLYCEFYYVQLSTGNSQWDMPPTAAPLAGSTNGLQAEWNFQSRTDQSPNDGLNQIANQISNSPSYAPVPHTAFDPGSEYEMNPTANDLRNAIQYMNLLETEYEAQERASLSDARIVTIALRLLDCANLKSYFQLRTMQLPMDEQQLLADRGVHLLSFGVVLYVASNYRSYHAKSGAGDGSFDRNGNPDNFEVWNLGQLRAVTT
ncbi:hypothetical protein BU16DRAFT_563472 [Lophium mytilinum]|uniref:WW domain-containing protein n=1 Tax=Lophium mytilinum TaxID=390894 RepID=A0A6A6QMG8_9PEZI|nr:hypothetical protein BU16DRAFT_563472 [Lophium mytilinum]